MEKNPHQADTPEWQLWENMKSAALLSQTYAADAQRYTKLSQEAREKSERFKAALERLA